MVKKAAKKEDDGLVNMQFVFDDEIIRVHPDQVPSHEAAGWKVVE